MEERYGFIGTGNMGGAVARAVCRAVGGEKVLLCNRTPEKARCLAQELGCGTADNETAAASCRYLFLGVKPQGMAPLLTALRPILQQHRPVLVSMAAGITAARLEELAGGNLPVMRIMPNTPVAIGCGVVMYCKNALLSPEDEQVLVQALSPAGKQKPPRMLAGIGRHAGRPGFALWVEPREEQGRPTSPGSSPWRGAGCWSG